MPLKSDRWLGPVQPMKETNDTVDAPELIKIQAAQISRLRAQLAKAIEALRPFATPFANGFEYQHTESTNIIYHNAAEVYNELTKGKGL